VPPFDESALATTTRAVLAHPPSPLATMDAYTLRAMQDATLSLYQDLADEPRPRHAG
jgi:hypothetical protein